MLYAIEARVKCLVGPRVGLSRECPGSVLTKDFLSKHCRHVTPLDNYKQIDASPMYSGIRCMLILGLGQVIYAQVKYYQQ